MCQHWSVFDHIAKCDMAAMTDALSRHAAFELAVNTALNDFPNVEAISEEQRKCLKHLVESSLSHLSPSLAFIFFALLLTSHRSPLSERLEQASLDLTVNFHHEHFIDPTNCPWVSEDVEDTTATLQIVVEFDRIARTGLGTRKILWNI